MGANVSSLENPHGFIHAKTPLVMELQSKHQWRSQYEASKQSDRLVVIYYTAAWCGPCKFIDPYVKDFAAMYTDVQFIKIDVDWLPEAAKAFDLIDVLPTFVLVKRGKEIDRVVGAKKDELQMKTEKRRN
ncbi:Thioredoxin H7 [Citrus sinensis]|uniref:Thioredoxin domain-containing protein n=1 Tax=Citrus clementina TaxID=85681 RepID=V4TJL4_CITCL|nr:thioredoxin H7 [Citrus x clementina]XP_006483262.1 thioredoxin H7 [Citrus sinensis]ESR51795.1 hypothetical protein CICLE_v10033071mg [Citrus x clementina]KAH9709321.1 Thioredoxin H7 [Citrus sinensis]GAY36542.1 hypothetical protein CUMW_022810 [Citrus unshiu]